MLLAIQKSDIILSSKSFIIFKKIIWFEMFKYKHFNHFQKTNIK